MFIEIPAITGKGRGCTRKALLGIGINNAPYQVRYTTSLGKQLLCPYYTTWKSMFNRCYSNTYRSKEPTYIGCTVTEEWHLFMTFKNWMQTQDWQNKALDKDLLIQGNKQYGPTTCIFITPAINNLLCLRKNYRGDYPLGVTRLKDGISKAFQTRISRYGKYVYLGTFTTPEEAHQVYVTAKLAYIQELALNENNPVIKAALLRLY